MKSKYNIQVVDMCTETKVAEAFRFYRVFCVLDTDLV